MLFGLPQRIAQRIWLSRAEYKSACAFLRPLELLLRRLIFLDALALEPDPTPESKRRLRLAMDTALGAAFDVDHPQAWRTHFHLAASDARLPAGKRRHALTFAHIHGVSSAPIALRLEALIRALNDPAPLVQRLARLLKRIPRAARAFIAAPHGLCARSCHQAVQLATHFTRAAYVEFCNST